MLAFCSKEATIGCTMSAERSNTYFEVSPPQEEVPDQDLVRLYLNEAIKFRLLEAEEEVELAQAIEAGLMASYKLREDYARLEAGEPPFSSDDDRELLLIAEEEGSRAKEAMINCNLRLVVSIAKKYQNRGLAFLDLIQFGNMGLMHAVEKFDYKKGFKFSTYADSWIRQKILSGLANDSRTIRIALHTSDQINKLNRIKRELTVELNRDPTLEELADAMGKSVEVIQELQTMDRLPVSINTELPEGKHGGTSELGDLITDDALTEPADDAMMTLMREDLIKAIERHTTSSRNRDMVLVFFGLSEGGLQKVTYKAVAKKFGMSHENARKIIARTVQRIGQYEAHLQEYLQD